MVESPARSLAASESSAIGAPVVQVQRQGHTLDLRGDYLRAMGEADILFPTHFQHLNTLVEAASRRAAGGGGAAVAARSLSTAEFMRTWHPEGMTRTGSGFDPLVDDFSNTAFCVTGGE